MKTEFVCPNCGSDKLLVREETSYYLNTMEFFCHSVKARDSDAKLICQECWWEGERKHVDKEC